MNMKVWVLFGLLLAFQRVVGQYEIDPKDMARLPGATLLVGYPPQTLAVTTGDETVILSPDPLPGPAVADENRIYPSMSRDGNLIALARWRGGSPDRIVTVATYSIETKKWTEYKTGQYRGAVAISGDGTKLAFEADVKATTTKYVDPITILDLKTGRESPGPEAPIVPTTLQNPQPHSFQLFLSWSPDGEQLAYGNNTAIWVWDTHTQQARRVGEGSAPAWSPSGEWIAYLDSPKDANHSNCFVVHPDGTGERILATLPHGRLFLEEPVWSPDSKTLLLNEMADGERWTMNIDFLDIATGKLKRIIKNKVPVYGWAAVKTK